MALSHQDFIVKLQNCSWSSGLVEAKNTLMLKYEIKKINIFQLDLRLLLFF